MISMLKFSLDSSVAAMMVIINLTLSLTDPSTYLISDTLFFFGQGVHAANGITQTTSEVNNCDPSSSCTTNPEQTANIGIGDGNRVDQDIVLNNLNCTTSSTCNLLGFESANLGQKIEATVIDEGSNNINTHSVTNDANTVNNNNQISQQIEEENNFCHDGAECPSRTEFFSSAGNAVGGVIMNEATSADNVNTELVTTSGSSNNNEVHQIQEQNSNSCNAVCTNFARERVEIGSVLGGGILSLGTGNMNTNIALMNSSANGNTITSIGEQENHHCTNPAGIFHDCSNSKGTQSSSIGSLGIGVIISNSNGVNRMTVMSQSSSNDNSFLDDSLQHNNECKDSQCGNSVSSNSIIGDTSAGEIFALGSGSTNNQNISKIFSTNENQLVSKEIQENSNCVDEAVCGNGLHNSMVIGRVGSSVIFEPFGGGLNNTHSQQIVQTGSGNGNLMNTYGTQTNSNCRTSGHCMNLASTGGGIGGESGLAIEDNGNNNVIFQNFTSNNSGNNNNINQKTLQENLNCTLGSFCFNSYGSDTAVQTGSEIISNSGNNNTIKSTYAVTDSNNNNQIFQQADQTNSNCSDGSTCLNSAGSLSLITLTPNNIVINKSNIHVVESNAINGVNNENSIVQLVNQNNLCREDSDCNNEGTLAADINAENNKQIDQSLTQQNLCLTQSTCSNNGIVEGGSGSNGQSNICVSDSTCSNSGTDNKNVCTNGAVCTNSGTDTKIISTGDPCSNTTNNSVTICSHGRIIHRPS